MSFLLTDICFLFVLTISFILTLMSLRKEPIRRSLLHISQQPLAVSAGIVLLFFLVIAVLDSIHLAENSTIETELATSQNNSILDKLLEPLGSSYENTYSAPFSLYSYSLETVFINGKVQQIYPRLNYPPLTIQTNAEKYQLIRTILFKSLLISVIGTLSLVSLYLFVKRIVKGYWTVSISCLSGVISLSICLFLVLAGYGISRYFHIFGTGEIGQDLFYYTIKSIRTGLVIGILTTLFMMPLALILGIAAGFFGGVIDDLVQYLYTTLSSIPGVLLITASVLSMQTYIANHPELFTTLAQNADARLLALCLILGVTSWTSLCRLLRAEVLKLREIDYVIAGRALGSSSLTIICKHLLPNVMHIVLITLVLDFSFLVLAEAVLSYVGVGVSPMTISWGNMINSARLELARDPIVWWPMMAAFVFMFTLVLASNLVADAVRDAFDPHQSYEL